MIYTWNREQWRVSGSSLSEQEALSRNTYKLAQLDSECSAFLKRVIQCSQFRSQAREMLRCEGTSAPQFSSPKKRNSECETSCQIIRPANPGRSSAGGMILGTWNAVRRARWNQIKTKLRSVRLQAHNSLLSMNFDRYKGNKRRKNRERKREREILYLRSVAPLGSQAAEFEMFLPWGRKEDRTIDFMASSLSHCSRPVSCLCTIAHKLITTCPTYWIIY